MEKKEISAATARQVAIEKIMLGLANSLDLVECPDHFSELVYCSDGSPLAEHYCFYIPSPEPRVGAGRIISISKQTGQVVFDGYVGE